MRWLPRCKWKVRVERCNHLGEGRVADAACDDESREADYKGSYVKGTVQRQYKSSRWRKNSAVDKGSGATCPAECSRDPRPLFSPLHSLFPYFSTFVTSFRM